MGIRGLPGTRRIKTDVFFGINIASSRYSEIRNREQKSINTAKTLIGRANITRIRNSQHPKQHYSSLELKLRLTIPPDPNIVLMTCFLTNCANSAQVSPMKILYLTLLILPHPLTATNIKDKVHAMTIITQNVN